MLKEILKKEVGSVLKHIVKISAPHLAAKSKARDKEFQFQGKSGMSHRVKGAMERPTQ